MKDKKEIKTEERTPGWNHIEYRGTCGPDVTVQDIKDKFYHPFFGGRGARVGNGKWFAVRHTD